MARTKLTLDVLAVESFETDSGVADPRGTVHAHAYTAFTSYCQCQNATNYGTCQGTCVDTCGGPTCDDPCSTAQTCHLTCQAGCSWTAGDVTCKQPPNG